MITKLICMTFEVGSKGSHMQQIGGAHETSKIYFSFFFTKLLFFVLCRVYVSFIEKRMKK